MRRLLYEVKRFIPWRLKLQLHLLSAKYPVICPGFVKQKSIAEDYNSLFYAHMDWMEIKNLKNKVLCELGPGDALSHAVLAYQHGASASILLDIEDLAGKGKKVNWKECEADSTVMPVYRGLTNQKENIEWERYLPEINTSYLTDGLSSYFKVKDNTVDYMFSNAVLEHVRKNIFEETVRQMYRMLKPGGICSHTVDLRDHIGGGLNHLRFSEQIWEDTVHQKMPNYVNRIGMNKILTIFKETGFVVMKVEQEYFQKPPLKYNQVHKDINQDQDDRKVKVFRFTAIKQ